LLDFTKENFPAYINNIGFTISAVKQTILSLLWEAKCNDANSTVWGKFILEQTGYQSDYAKRIRELRECGCKITSFNIKGNYFYTMASTEMGKPVVRKYLSKKQKSALFEKHNYCCNICGADFQQSPAGHLHSEHRIPLCRHPHKIDPSENWQTACKNCNNIKIRMCKTCADDCTQCIWAFPENHRFILLKITTAQTQQLAAAGICGNEAICAYIKKKTGI